MAAEQSRADPADALPATRRALADALLHAATHSPYYRDQPWAADFRAGKTIGFRDIPTTGKDLVRSEAERFYSSFVPPTDGKVDTRQTSGSTGEPLFFRMTRRAQRINRDENNRLRSGWGLRSHRAIAHIVNPNKDHPIGTEEDGVLPNGGHWWSLYTEDIRAAFDLFQRTSATAAWGFPSLLFGALEIAVETAQPLPLRQIWSWGEVVPDGMRELLGAMPECRLVDTYGCEEAGLLAMQCPLCDSMHPASRQTHVELLTEDGRPAATGEMGQVVITPLFNRAMPLIRYETGDYALRALRNDCPRRSLAIERILGRKLNLFRLLDGRRIRPRLPHAVTAELGVRKLKLFQKAYGEIELHYVPLNPMAEVADGLAQALIDRYMSPGFKVRAVRVADIPRAPGGKYLSHESLV